jgi:Uma2 family endonuclease
MTQQLKPVSLSGRKLTYEEFLAWDGENQHLEWLDGEIVQMAPVGDAHQDLHGFLSGVIRALVVRRKLGIVRNDPFQMKTGPDLPGRAPDILFVSKDRVSLVKPLYVDGPADLVIEITSPGSRTIDRRDKLGEYQTGGVREYWILDPERKKADFFHLGSDGKYVAITEGADGIYRSLVIEPLWIRVAWLWQKPLPEEFDVYKEWGLI